MSRGVILVATGERCRREAVESVAVLRATNPSCAVTVLTDDVASLTALEAVGVQVVALEAPQRSLADKIAGFRQSPYERTLFLDTDAFLAADAEELFRLLDRFEIAAAHAPGRSGDRIHPYESPAIPSAFPQLNTGVVAFRRSPVVERTIERWAEIFDASPHHLHDQPSFRQAVYESGAAVTVLPPEWNALGGGAYYSGPIRILHVHGQTADGALREVARLNATCGPRLVTRDGAVLAEPLPGLEMPATAATPVPARTTPARTTKAIAFRRPEPLRHDIEARADIPDLLNRLGLLGTAVEVGVKEGRYSETILAGWHGRLLISVDPWLEAPTDEYLDIANVPQSRHEEFLAATRRRLAPFGDRSEIWRLTGDEAAERIPDRSLDFVYLDARHDYASVRSDIGVWLPKVRPGGIVAGHDYLDGDLPEGVFGVRSAVDELFGERGIAVGVTTAEPATFPSWIVRVPHTLDAAAAA